MESQSSRPLPGERLSACRPQVFQQESPPPRRHHANVARPKPLRRQARPPKFKRVFRGRSRMIYRRI